MYYGIGIVGMGIELPLGFCTGVRIELELLLPELELNCENGIDPSSGVCTVELRLTVTSLIRSPRHYELRLISPKLYSVV